MKGTGIQVIRDFCEFLNKQVVFGNVNTHDSSDACLYSSCSHYVGGHTSNDHGHDVCTYLAPS